MKAILFLHAGLTQVLIPETAPESSEQYCSGSVSRYPVPEEVIEQLRQQAEQLQEGLERAGSVLELERRRAQQLAARLRALGIDPDSLSSALAPPCRLAPAIPPLSFP